DKITYPAYMQNLALNTKNLDVKEGMVVALLHDDNHVFGVRLENGQEITSSAVILTTGTYMESCILRGHTSTSAGPDGEKPSLGLSPYLKSMGIDLFRLKTGTPPRIKQDTIDYSKTTPQYGTEGDLAFSFTTKQFKKFEDQIKCWLIYTTPETHQIIRDNLGKSAMYGGIVTGIGPRYCPSIEDKIVRFADKERHQLFLEPESLKMNSIYLQGFSTSMPEDVQDLMIHSLPGLENCEVLKYAYAIEYDALVPTQFYPSLEMKKYAGLFCAGQIIGTSGYEEAAGLGLMAGINASLKCQGKDPLILRRDEAYIGVMIDDLVTKGTVEPYRLLSSRAEYRLLMRHDNADLRLTEHGHNIGLISDERYAEFTKKKEAIYKAIEILKSNFFGAGPNSKDVNDYLVSKGYERLLAGESAQDLLRRQNITFKELRAFIRDFDNFEIDEYSINEVEIMVKYEGYIEKQIHDAANMVKMENMKISPNIDFMHMDGLALEARQKLDKIRPLTVGQASRISGVNPSDIGILIMNLKRER
ncbi:MAG: tRNA uridine-5-carboxymethylaminomethyl(34) synthesis enzyme MnmG, partial [Bacilli bacterium]|nr:tRNA uridine-5-carboxymethylaminomethyl(34) synthesis enzyme MnmG [Bacilli bacterium]